MATLKQLQNAYANPNTRRFLDFIAQAEGVKHGYNTLFGNERFGNLGAHPNVKKSFTQTDGKTNYTTAAGRYQFLKGTWDGLANRYGFADFSPRSQDLGAIALISGRGALEDVLNGNYQSAIKKLGGEWASLPSSKYAQGKRSWDFVSKHLGGEGATQQLTVADLERKYGKGKPYQASNATQNNKQLTIADLERQYGKGQPYASESNLGAESTLTVADLEKRYGKGQIYQF